VKVVIVAARQEAAALSKDGKTLLGPILPRLLARHTNGKGGDWRNKSAVGLTTGVRPLGAKMFAPRRPPFGALAAHRSPAGGAGKENRNKNAASAPAAARPAAARPAKKPADT
jgi:hypothetical protein